MGRQIIYKIKKLFNETDIQIIQKELINIFSKEPVSIEQEDYQILEVLFVGNLGLDLKDPGSFWSPIEVLENLSEDLKIYIGEILKNEKNEDGPFYIKKLKQYGDRNSFKYLIARSLVEEGRQNNDPAKLEEGIGIFQTLIWGINRDLGNPYNYDQVIASIGMGLLELSALLPIKEAIICVDRIRDLNRENSIFDPLDIYKASLIGTNNAQSAMGEAVKLAREEIRQVSDNYQIKNMEILSIFVAIICFVFGAGSIALQKEVLLNDRLILLGGLSSCLLLVLSALISMLRWKWVAPAVLGIIIIFLVSLGGLSIIKGLRLLM